LRPVVREDPQRATEEHDRDDGESQAERGLARARSLAAGDAIGRASWDESNDRRDEQRRPHHERKDAEDEPHRQMQSERPFRRALDIGSLLAGAEEGSSMDVVAESFGAGWAGVLLVIPIIITWFVIYSAVLAALRRHDRD
jgi:hypothetical protein